jgi:hypothetical protein
VIDPEVVAVDACVSKQPANAPDKEAITIDLSKIASKTGNRIVAWSLAERTHGYGCTDGGRSRVRMYRVAPRTQDHWLSPCRTYRAPTSWAPCRRSRAGSAGPQLPSTGLPLGERPGVVVPRLCGGEQVLAPDSKRKAVRMALHPAASSTHPLVDPGSPSGFWPRPWIPRTATMAAKAVARRPVGFPAAYKWRARHLGRG